MVGRISALSALVAFAHSKAIVTNNCRKDVYIWSVPEKADLANNLSISPGKRYEEPWRVGTAVNPGVAIKISTERDGIYTSKSEINFQYDVDASDSTKIWIDLATVRGGDFDNATLNTCHGGFKSPHVPTKQCSSTDDIELVLCGSERTVPSQDTTPVRVISNCIEPLAERDGSLQPRICSGRVVGPKRMPITPDDQEDQWLAESVDTIPLKTVMRFEAAKHAASHNAEAHEAARAHNTAVAKSATGKEKATSSGPMCDLLHKAWPDAQCDEKMAQHNAKLFYEDNCGKKTRNMFPGVSCEAIRHQMEQIYPDVVTKRDNHLTMCINPYYAWFEKFWGSRRTVKAVLNNNGPSDWLFPERSWTSDEELCQKPNKTVHPVLKDGKDRFKRCIVPFCRKGNRLGGDCSDVEDDLEKLSIDAGWEIDWTSEDDVCSGWVGAAAEVRDIDNTLPTKREHPTLAKRQVGNVITGHRWNDIRNVCVTTANEKLGKYWGANETERLIQSLFPGVRWTTNLDDCSPQAISESRDYHHKLIDKKQHKEKKCVVGCQGKTCNRVKKELNNLSKDVGQNWSWTDDETFCASNITFDSDGPDVSKCVMGESEITKLYAYWGDAREDVMDEIFPRINWLTDEDCDLPYDNAAKKWFRDHRVKGKRAQRCVSPYCKPFHADCSDVEDQLENVSKNLGYEIDWTTDDDACPKDAVYPVNHVARNEYRAYPSEVCALASCRYYSLSDVECLKAADLAEEIVFGYTGSRVKFSVDGPACRGTKANEFPQLPPSKAKRSSPKVCRKDFCGRSDQNANECKKIEHSIRNLLNKTMHMDIEFTDNHKVCGSTLLRTTFEEPTAYVYNTSLPSICSKAYCAPRVPGVDCAVVHRDFGAIFQIEAIPLMVGDATTEHVCHDESSLHLPVIRDQSHRQRLCVRHLCTLSESKYGRKCATVLPLVQRYYKDTHNVDVIASVEDDVCGK